MVLKTYSCDVCENRIVRDISMNAPVEQQRALSELCDVCRVTRRFSRVYLPITVRFGGTHAVKGWGTHALDYPNPKSDLIAGRAQEVSRNTPEFTRD